MTDTPARPARRIQAGPVRLSFRIWNSAPSPGSSPEPGYAGAPPVVLLHGPGEDAADWEPLARELAPSWRVHAPDLRGHGDSERSGPYTVDQLTDDLEAFTDALGLRRVALVGHSIGAVPAYLFAARHPDRVIRLVLEEPVPPFPRGPVDLRQHLDRHGERPSAPPFDPEAMKLSDEFADPPAAWREALARITAPTLLLAGGSDSHLDQDRLAEMASLIPGCELATIPAGHLIHESDPGTFTAAVTAFLGAARS